MCDIVPSSGASWRISGEGRSPWHLGAGVWLGDKVKLTVADPLAGFLRGHDGTRGTGAATKRAAGWRLYGQ